MKFAVGKICVELRHQVCQTLLVGVGAVVSFAGVASAQVLVDHQARLDPGRMDLAPVISFSSVEYEGSGNGSGEIERTIFGLTGGYGLTRDLDLYAELGYIQEAEIEDSRDDDDGYLLGAGVRGVLLRQDKLSLRGYGGLRYINEEYGDGVKGDLIELAGGVVGRAQVQPEFGLYAGLDIVPISEGDIDFRGGSADLERDDFFGLRAGADFFVKGVTLSGEFALISEEGVTFRVGFPL